MGIAENVETMRLYRTCPSLEFMILRDVVPALQVSCEACSVIGSFR